MQHSVDFEYDTAAVINIGGRERQEDALATDFLAGSGFGFAVLADGMGGHVGGDIASRIVVTEVFTELKLRVGDSRQLEAELQEALLQAAAGANACLSEYIELNPALQGMGATLLAPVLFSNRLYWISIGDSPLYLYRSGQLSRLNADHSMAAEIDALVAKGRLSPSDAAEHPDRHCVTSVLSGTPVPRVDCRQVPVDLAEGDILLAASDGLLTLSEMEIASVLAAERNQSSARIGTALMHQLETMGQPEQDNISICVIKPFESAAKTTDAELAFRKTKLSHSQQRRGRRIITLLASVKHLPNSTPGSSEKGTSL